MKGGPQICDSSFIIYHKFASKSFTICTTCDNLYPSKAQSHNGEILQQSQSISMPQSMDSLKGVI